MRSGDAFTQLIEFSGGFPDGNISWVLLDGNGTQVTSGTVTPTAGSVSAVVTVSGANNTLGVGELFAHRELKWSYLTGGLTVGGNSRYRVDAFLAYGVSEDGVRNKLGIEQHEISNEAINLVMAYAAFENTVGTANFSAVTGAYNRMVVTDAIEALAALRLIPMLQVKIAQREVSGASQFQRGKINWAELTSHLNEMIAAGYSVANPAFDSTANYGSIFTPVVRTPDVITGEDVA